MSAPETNINGNVESIGMPSASPEATIHSPEIKPRKRGRPSNAEIAARSAQEKIDGANPAKQAEAKAKAKATKTGKSFVEPNIEKMAKQIMGVHMIADKMLAKFTGVECLALAESESYALAEGIASMSREFEIVVSGKTAAMLQFAVTAAMIYAPRFVYFTEKAKESRAIVVRNEDSNGNVSDHSAG